MSQSFQLPIEQLSVQLYTVRRELEEDLAGTIAKIADLGFRSIEPFNFVASAAPLAEALAAHQLTAPTGHAPLLSADQDEIFSAARTLGMSTVIEPFIPEDRWTSRADIEQTAAALNSAAARAAEYGLSVGYHNHWWEVGTEFEGTTALELFAGLLNDEVLLEVDTYWAAISGKNPAALLQRLGDRVKFVHLKDGPLTTEPLDQLPVGQGKMNIPEVLAAVPALQYAVMEFDDFRGDIFDGLAQSLSYLRKDS
ncbi:sugar phosphate isomerase/epimerase family protein [Psychromicrobium sp. YIM B11713]|uniref:sugar phosphate isomerase/epimerase family protein n=1 Tax=Psychromicrobium sp. YIM B11713 TaxID=3145233 RepID=UPI00374E8A91